MKQEKFEILYCKRCKTTFTVATKSIGNECGSYTKIRKSLNYQKYCCNNPIIVWYNSIPYIWLEDD